MGGVIVPTNLRVNTAFCRTYGVKTGYANFLPLVHGHCSQLPPVTTTQNRSRPINNVPCLTSRNERECKVSYSLYCTSLAVTAPGVRLVLLCLPMLVLYTLGVDRDIYGWSLDMGMFVYSNIHINMFT